MKSFNVDYKFKDLKFIEEAIIKTCTSKKKSRKGNNRKYNQAQHILDNLEKYIKKTLETILAFEEMQKIKSHGGKIDIKTFKKAYKPKKCDPFITRDNPSRKERKITSAPLFPDQVIHQLIVMAMEPVLMKYMYRHSYGSVPGRGVHKGKQYVEKIINRHTKHNKSEIKYAAQLDISKCYKNIPHKELKKQLNNKFRGRFFLDLSFAVIDSYRDNLEGEPIGIPIGYSTSHWFCNFLLTPLDHAIKQEFRVRYYIRYMDDMVLFGRNKKELHKTVRLIMKRLKKIGLKIKYNWQVFRFDYLDKYKRRRGRDIDFLGYRFFRDKIILRKRNALILRRQAMSLYKKNQISGHDARSFMSRLGWLRHCNSYNYYHKYIKPYINTKKIKEVISHESRKYNQA